jgi:hypothetical protein
MLGESRSGSPVLGWKRDLAARTSRSVGPPGRAQRLATVSELYENLTCPENLSTILELELCFYKLDENSSDEILNRLVDDFVRLLEPMMGSASALEMDRLGTSTLINRIAKRLKP